LQRKVFYVKIIIIIYIKYKNMPEIFKDVIDNENQDIVDKINSFQDNSQENINDKQALYFLKKIDSQAPGYDIDLAKDGNKYRFIVENKAVLNISLDNNEILEIWQMLVDLLKFDWDLHLIWGKEWRAISEKNMFWWGYAWEKRIVNKWLEALHNIDFYRNENNKIEELFKFVQSYKWVPESDWYISNSIRNTWPIWIIRNKKGA